MRSNLDKKKTEQVLLVRQLKDNTKSLRTLKLLNSNQCEARSLFQKAATLTQLHIESHVNSIVNMTLKAIFDNPYEFTIRFVSRRNVTEADLLLIRDEIEFSPLDAVGGGVVDILSIALRIAYWSMEENTRAVIFWDEPTRNCSINLHSSISAMFKMMCEELQMQFIIVSHQQNMINSADKVFNIE